MGALLWGFVTGPGSSDKQNQKLQAVASISLEHYKIKKSAELD
jgi:hypothetical protein